MLYSSQVINSIPNRALTNLDLIKYAAILKLPHFRGVFMRDNLPLIINKDESAIINLDSITGKGTHWVCYRKHDTKIEYFDSFGNLTPPLELQVYFNSGRYKPTVRYNYYPKQKHNSVNCGHLCLNFLATWR